MTVKSTETVLVDDVTLENSDTVTVRLPDGRIVVVMANGGIELWQDAEHWIGVIDPFEYVNRLSEWAPKVAL